MSYIDTLGGTGVWDWVQDIYDYGAGDFVWSAGKLGAWSDLLGWRGDGGYLIRCVYIRITKN